MPGLQPHLRLPAEHHRVARPLAAPRAGPVNDWNIDRAAQATGGNYTGITGIHAQDQAVTESVGAISPTICTSISAPAT